MSDASFRFTHAISRRPSASIIQGLRAVDTGTPDLALMQAHHAAYIATLRETGATVVELPPLEAFPDSVFVEDTALCLPQGAVVMRPGAPSRPRWPSTESLMHVLQSTGLSLGEFQVLAQLLPEGACMFEGPFDRQAAAGGAGR